ncbi:metalloregulator ArsR/SmtB family transcription factor [Breoghania sp.]|uniref:ArsR/SmtB family transcription factor n=1 Tax=Breoghania sp. TaxID=2065378 RepID=UPI002AA7B050|nr:metalloregulator ArsR/SmtB family transcription factor [Breoghania sp.]
MPTRPPTRTDMADTDELAARAGEAARLMKLLASESRLRILCELAQGEACVTALSNAVGLGQSALSQHLAKMRAEGLVTFRREGQTLHYRIDNPAAERILMLLKDVFCGV